VAEPGARGRATRLDVLEFPMDHLFVYNNGFEVSQIVRKQFAIRKPATEVVNTFSNLITLKSIKITRLTLRITVPSGVDLVLLITEHAAP